MLYQVHQTCVFGDPGDTVDLDPEDTKVQRYLRNAVLSLTQEADRDSDEPGPDDASPPSLTG